MFIKSSLTQVNSGFLISAKLACTKAAENAWQLPQTTNQRSVQQRGVLYAKSALEMIHSWEKKELTKAQVTVARVEKLRVKTMKKIMQYLKTAMGSWTNDHQNYFEQMALGCNESCQ